MNKLKKEMQSVGITASELAKKSGVDKSTISRILNNKGYNPTIRTWYKLMNSINELKK